MCTIKRIDHASCLRVRVVFCVDSGLQIAPHSVFWRKQRDKVRQLIHNVYRAFHFPIDSSRIGNQSNAFALEKV